MTREDLERHHPPGDPAVREEADRGLRVVRRPPMHAASRRGVRFGGEDAPPGLRRPAGRAPRVRRHHAADDLDADKVETATFSMDDSSAASGKPSSAPGPSGGSTPGLADADRNVVFDAMDGARLALCKLASGERPDVATRARPGIRGHPGGALPGAYHTPDCVTSDPIPESEFAGTIEGDIDNALAAVMEEVRDA